MSVGREFDKAIIKLRYLGHILLLTKFIHDLCAPKSNSTMITTNLAYFITSDKKMFV